MTLFLNSLKEIIKVFSYILLLAQQGQAVGLGSKGLVFPQPWTEALAHCQHLKSSGPMAGAELGPP